MRIGVWALSGRLELEDGYTKRLPNTGNFDPQKPIPKRPSQKMRENNKNNGQKKKTFEDVLLTVRKSGVHVEVCGLSPFFIRF